MRGGEKVIESLCRLYPDADIYTHVHDPGAISRSINEHRISTTFIQQLPFAKRLYQLYLPLMPLALEQLDLREYDLVISSESGPSKGVLLSPETLHVCYCSTPMRYIWDMYRDHLDRASLPVRMMMRPLTHYLRLWDQASAARVDHFFANSSFVANRVRKFYRRDAEVLPPPVDVARFANAAPAGDYYLMLGELVAYKRPEIAIEAFRRLGRKLVVVGKGPLLRTLQQSASANVQFMGHQSDDRVRALFAGCRALVFPGLEDFGIVPVEAMAAGRPVVAFGRGGALDTIVDGKTGVLFHEQTAEALAAAVTRLEAIEARLDPAVIAAHAAQFDRRRFEARFAARVDRLLADARAAPPATASADDQGCHELLGGDRAETRRSADPAAHGTFGIGPASRPA